MIGRIGHSGFAFGGCGSGHGNHDQVQRLPKETPLEILKRRYAAGEISREEFERMKQELGY